MKRLLCIISSMNAGGAETFLMKIFRKLDKTKFQMDFCINVSEKCYYEDEILSLGGRIYRIPAKSINQTEFQKQLYSVVYNNQYEYVLRITSNGMGFMDLKIAKKAGAKICAARSSNSSDGVGLKLWISHRLGQLLYGKYADVKFAPSDLAAQYTFGKNAYRFGNVVILHNAVDLDVFRYDTTARSAIRKEFGVAEDDILVGHIGRFMPQKNHGFLLQVFYEIVKKYSNAKLLLVGNGEMAHSLRIQVIERGLADKVIFAGLRADIPHILSAMDTFVFPSLYEGMPNTVIEAQATGLPCIIADTITREANITGLVHYLPLESPKMWADKAIDVISPQRAETRSLFISQKYDIESTTAKFVRLVFGE